ncbi:MAG: PEP-CTERM sorting domain-containing protein [Phycisphaerae bacterium]|jgi:hypothetical protein|nr:PEP-CTERM sorting domain-containing protein [Phycisphaerae bacterium]
MTRTKVMTICVSVAILAISGVVHAVPISVETDEIDFAVVGSGFSAVGPAETTDFSGDHLSATIVSQAFADNSGAYLYLYQISNNNGQDNHHTITRFTANPYAQGQGGISLGYLTDNANVPSAFSSGEQGQLYRAPLYGDIDADAGPTVGFNYPVGIPLFGVPDSYIGQGEKSLVMYIQTDIPPGLVTGNIINGGVQSGMVVGPVPEPATLSLLALGGLFVLRRRRR